MRRIGLLMGFLGTLRAESSLPTYRLHLLNLGGAAGLLFILTLVSSGCADLSRRNSELTYGNASDYTAYSYNDPNAFGPYDPLLYGYWYPQPYYYYRNYAGDNDHDCDDGYCGPHRSHRPSPIVPRPLAAPRPLTATRDAEGVRTAGVNGSGFHSGGAAAFGGHGSSHR